MDTKLPQPKLLQSLQASQLNKKRISRHKLEQLFGECTLRCNLSYIHCGSDCRAITKQHDMPFDDFRTVLDDVRTVMNPNEILIVTTGGDPFPEKTLWNVERLSANLAFIGEW